MDIYQRIVTVILICTSIFFSAVLQGPNYQQSNISNQRIETITENIEKEFVVVNIFSHFLYDKSGNITVVVELTSNVGLLEMQLGEVNVLVDNLKLDLKNSSNYESLGKWEFSSLEKLDLQSMVTILYVSFTIGIRGYEDHNMQNDFKILVPNKATFTLIFLLMFILFLILSLQRYWHLFAKGERPEISYFHPVRNNLIVLVIFIFTSDFSIFGDEKDGIASILSIYEISRLFMIHSSILLVFAYFAPVQMERLFLKNARLLEVPADKLNKFAEKGWSRLERRTTIFVILNLIFRNFKWGFMLGLMLIYSATRAISLQGEYEKMKNKSIIRRLKKMKKQSKEDI